MGGRWVQSRLVESSCTNRFAHGLVDFKNHAFRAVVAISLFVFSTDNRKCLHDVVHICASHAIEVEVQGVQLAPEEKAALLIPAKWRTCVTARSCYRQNFIVGTD